jgi:DNA repair protein RadD
MILRPYQEQGVKTLISALALDQTALCVMATGLGKTEVFMELAHRAGVKTAILVGRDKLVEQTARRMGFDVGVWSAGQGIKRIGQRTVISIHSADGLVIPDLKLIICDEAHNLNDGRYADFISRHPTAKIVGFTATPWRGGYEIFGEGKLFPRINFKRGLLKGIEDGYLVRPVSKAMPNAWRTEGLSTRGDDFVLSDLNKLMKDSGKVKAQVEDAMGRLTERRKIVWICTSIEHAEDVASYIGETVSIVHSKKENNEYAIELFERGDVRHMVSVMMLSEGYDFPAIDSIVLMRPTKSPTLYVQAVGRGLRPMDGKKDCLILDYGEVIKNCGPVHDPITKSDRKAKGKKESLEITMRVCPKCLSYVEPTMESCPDCGHEMKVERDPLKSLTRQASDNDILGDIKPRQLDCLGVKAVKYLSKKGNNCIKLQFEVGAMWPISMFISEHPYSWTKGKKTIEALTPFEFDSWQECYDACESLIFNVPEWVEVQLKNGFETITRISDRTRDTQLAGKIEDRLLLEEHEWRIF